MLYFQQIRCLAGAVAVMARPEIMAVNGLKGNRAGVDVCVLGAKLRVNALESAGMTINDIQMVQLIQSEMKRCSRIKVRSAVVPVPMTSGRLWVANRDVGRKLIESWSWSSNWYDLLPQVDSDFFSTHETHPLWHPRSREAWSHSWRGSPHGCVGAL
jgi:hypothetical protein